MQTAAARLRWIPWMVLGVFLLKLVAMPASLSERGDATAARAQALARGEPDASGRTTPLLVHDAGERWFQPVAVYPAALLIRAGLPPRIAVRAPAIVAAAITAFLTYFLALRLLQSQRIGAFAVLFLVVSPAWASFGSAAGADFAMVAAVLGFLWAIAGWREQPSMKDAVLTGAMLGISSWTQPAGVLAIPLFFGVGVALMTERQRSAPVLAATAAGVAIPLLICGVWLVRHPDAYPDTFGRWAIHAAHVRNPWDGLIAVTNWAVMARRAAEYWSYLNPTFLFDGRSLFTIGLIAFVAPGLWAALAAGRRVAPLAIAFLAVPAAAAFLDMPRDPSLVLMMAPLGALVAAFGVEWLLAQRGGRPLVFVLLVVVFATGALTNVLG